MALPAEVHLDAYRGDSWAQTFRLKGIDPDTGLEEALDLTGCEVASAVRDVAGAITPINVQVTLPPTLGEVTIGLPPELEAGKYGYDVEVTEPTGIVTTWVRGRLNVVDDVTHGLVP